MAHERLLNFVTCELQDLSCVSESRINCAADTLRDLCSALGKAIADKERDALLTRDSDTPSAWQQQKARFNTTLQALDLASLNYQVLQQNLATINNKNAHDRHAHALGLLTFCYAAGLTDFTQIAEYARHQQAVGQVRKVADRHKLDALRLKLREYNQQEKLAKEYVACATDDFKGSTFQVKALEDEIKIIQQQLRQLSKQHKVDEAHSSTLALLDAKNLLVQEVAGAQSTAEQQASYTPPHATVTTGKEATRKLVQKASSLKRSLTTLPHDDSEQIKAARMPLTKISRQRGVHNIARLSDKVTRYTPGLARHAMRTGLFHPRLLQAAKRELAVAKRQQKTKSDKHEALAAQQDANNLCSDIELVNVRERKEIAQIAPQRKVARTSIMTSKQQTLAQQLATQKTKIKRLEARSTRQQSVLEARQQSIPKLPSKRRILAFKAQRIAWASTDCEAAYEKCQKAVDKGEYDISTWSETLPARSLSRQPINTYDAQLLNFISLLFVGASTLQYRTDSAAKNVKCGFDLCINLLLNTLKGESADIDMLRIEAALAICQGFINSHMPDNTFVYSRVTLDLNLWQRICVAFDMFKALHKEIGYKVALSSARDCIFFPTRSVVGRARYTTALQHAADVLADEITPAPNSKI